MTETDFYDHMISSWVQLNVTGFILLIVYSVAIIIWVNFSILVHLS